MISTIPALQRLPYCVSFESTSFSIGIALTLNGLWTVISDPLTGDQRTLLFRMEKGAVDACYRKCQTLRGTAALYTISYLLLVYPTPTQSHFRLTNSSS
jgi:hypothetical protein